MSHCVRTRDLPLKDHLWPTQNPISNPDQFKINKKLTKINQEITTSTCLPNLYQLFTAAMLSRCISCVDTESCEMISSYPPFVHNYLVAMPLNWCHQHLHPTASQSPKTRPFSTWTPWCTCFAFPQISNQIFKCVTVALIGHDQCPMTTSFSPWS
jgi:hypothetical protein